MATSDQCNLPEECLLKYAPRLMEATSGLALTGSRFGGLSMDQGLICVAFVADLHCGVGCCWVSLPPVVVCPNLLTQESREPVRC